MLSIWAIIRAFQPIDYYGADIAGLEHRIANRIKIWSESPKEKA